MGPAMNAQEITKALDGRWHGSYGVAKCPCHDDHEPSLSVRDGADGDLVVNCFARCDWRNIKDVLRARGLLPKDENRPRALNRRRPPPVSRTHPEPSPNRDHALEIWRASRDPIGTLTAAYLSHRAITIATPATIRDHPGLKHAPTGQNLPAMVAAITGADRKVTAIGR